LSHSGSALQATQDHHAETASDPHQQVADLQQDIALLENQFVEQLAMQKQAYEGEIQHLQTQAFRGQRSDRFQPDDDSTIASHFVRIQGRIMVFAKRYATNSSNHLESLPDRSLAQLRSALNDAGVATLSSNRELLEVAKPRHGARLCLTGLLSSAVHRMAFDNPFFFMSDCVHYQFDASVRGGQYGSVRMDSAHAFKNFLDMVAEGTGYLLSVI
jgi:TolA-binding protein